MKQMFVMLSLMLISSSANGYDAYVENAKPDWTIQVKINSKAFMKSNVRFDSKNLWIFRTTIRAVEKDFFKYYDIMRITCRNDPVYIIVITEHELSKRNYFPGEDEYSDSAGIVMGRYFRGTNTLYIVPPFLKQYNWRETMAHEMLHYLYDDCNMVFDNDDEEHKEIKRFLDAHSHLYE